MKNKIDKKEATPNTFPSIEKKEIRAVLEKLISNLSKGSSPEAGFIRTFNENKDKLPPTMKEYVLNEFTSDPNIITKNRSFRILIESFILSDDMSLAMIIEFLKIIIENFWGRRGKKKS